MNTYSKVFPRVMGVLLAGTALCAVASQGVGNVTTIATLDASMAQHPEGIVSDPFGNIYVGMLPTGAVWKISPDGTVDQNFASFAPELGHGLGMLGFAMDEDGDLYVAMASGTAGTHGVWKLDRHGGKTLVAFLPQMTNPYNGYTGYGLPNGLAFDEDHNLYVADSWLSVIWKINRAGTVSVWAQDPLLGAPSGATGANNDAIDGGYLYVTNSDQASIVRIKLREERVKLHEEENARRKVELFVQSPAVLSGADGITFDEEHNAYVNAAQINTAVRVHPDRTIETLATPADGLDWPADNAFDQRRGKRKTLLWTNGGWLLGHPSVDEQNVGIRGATPEE
jgi:sugar lactone lactonase YvrE